MSGHRAGVDMLDDNGEDEPTGVFRRALPPRRGGGAGLLITEVTRPKPPTRPGARAELVSAELVSAELVSAELVSAELVVADDALEETDPGQGPTTLAPSSLLIAARPRGRSRFWPWAIAAMLVGGGLAAVVKLQARPEATRATSATHALPRARHEAKLPPPDASASAKAKTKPARARAAARQEPEQPIDPPPIDLDEEGDAEAQPAQPADAAHTAAAAPPAEGEAQDAADAQEADEPSAPRPQPHRNPLREPYRPN
jgi:hypothetical protein